MSDTHQSPFPSDKKSIDNTSILKAPAREKFAKFDEQKKVITSDFIASFSQKSSSEPPSTKFKELSKLSQEYEMKLMSALRQRDHLELTNLIFDAECEDLDTALDLNMYQEEAQKLM